MASTTQILFNEPPGPGINPTSLVELLRWRAVVQPERSAYSFWEDGGSAPAGLTYEELDRKARAIGALLQSLNASGQRVLLILPPGLDYLATFFGILYAGAVAVPSYPPRPNQSLARFETIVGDSEAAIVAASSAQLSRIERSAAASNLLNRLRWVAIDEVADDIASAWKEPELGKDALAFLQYTSGSTARPKGVMVTHANLLYNERMIQSAFGQSEDSVIVSWLPLYHDMGLIGGVLQPLYLGARCVLMSPVSFLQRPLNWLQAISDHRATTSGGPNFAYDLCVRKIKADERAQLDLSSWSVAFNGAEPIRAETLDRFAEAFGPCGFRKEAFSPCYGLAEATLIVSGGRRPDKPLVKGLSARELEKNIAADALTDDEGSRHLVSCGAELLEERIVIVDPESFERRAPGEVGEIWVAGPNVARGYWNKADETEKVFRARLSDTGEGPFLRTGDLGFLCDDQLFVTGRLKDLIIIRGLNRYPHDIELVVERSHAALRPGCGAAFSVDVEGEERLVVVQEVDRKNRCDLGEVITAIREGVAREEEIEPYAIILVNAGSVPKTSSGKIQRRACRGAFLDGRLEPLAEWRATAAAQAVLETELPDIISNDLEAVQTWLVSLAARKLRIDATAMDCDHSLSLYGLDSLMAIEITHEIETRLGVSPGMSALLEGRTIRELAKHIVERLENGDLRGDEKRVSSSPTEAGRYPLSYAQKAMWFMYQMAPDSSLYNIVNAISITGDLDAPTLRRAFESLVDRHSCLRARFTVEEGEPFQVHTNEAELFFIEEDASGWDAAALTRRLDEEAHRPIDLEQGPLFRINLFKLSEQEHVLLIAIHHIIADFWSLAVLLKELGIFYEAEKTGAAAQLAPVSMDYGEYSLWQERMLSSPEGERLWAYWLGKLRGELTALELPTDRPRPPVQTYRGGTISFKLGEELTRRIKAVGASRGATLYMSLMAAFQVLLHRYTGQEEILVGSPVSGRPSSALSNTVGCFVNSVVVRGSLAEDPTFEQVLDRVRQTALEAFEHQDYPFTSLVERLQPVRDFSRSPLFQVMFALQKAPSLDDQDLASFALGEAGSPVTLCDLRLEPVALDRRIAQFDLSLMMAETGDGLSGSLQYNADLFEPLSMERMAAHFRILLEAAASDPKRHISRLPLLTEDEEQKQLIDWNGVGRDYSRERFIHKMFEDQARRTPEAIAIITGEERLTYEELNDRAERLADYLTRSGVATETCVGIFMERSVEMVVGILAVLKAGGAYLPLDPEYPEERLQFMLEDSHASMLLTQKKLADKLPPHSAQTIFVDDDRERLEQQPSAGSSAETFGESLAYVLYTSGSTGKPKGVMISHDAIRNHMAWMSAAFPLDESDRVLQKTAFSFDASVWEFYAPLIAGATLVMASPGAHRDPRQLVDEIVKYRITTLQLVPTLLRALLDQTDISKCKSLRRVFVGGEVLTTELVHELKSQLDVEVYNLYGPTEAAIDTTCQRCEGGRERQVESLGRPISNAQVYLLDTHLQLAPILSPSEIYIAGAGLARGYLNAPEMTADRFIPNPFGQTAGSRLYRTRDVGRYLSDGSIEYIGRSDQQVKVRGYRIEFGEVEAVLSQHPDVSEAIISFREDSPGDRRLVAYVVTKAGAETTADSLRGFLKESLPDYMLPSSFMFLDDLPLTSNGKVDRRALPAPDRSAADLGAGFVAPGTLIEEALAAIWSELLGLEKIGINNDFFDLGGHSLLASQVVSRVRDIFQIELPLRRFFLSPTISGLAAAVVEYSDDSCRVDKIADLYLSIVRASDDELEAALQN
ncbi:MAG TPA: amino acid adenylation domain-containing protein [Blastocatellia bacterium]|nr:amino acid adenylation domain-containing protein [Blastocatellia bacterium]